LTERVLIVRLAAVGDVVMASTLARRIRDQHQDASITWLCSTTVAPLVEQFADVDEIITVDERQLLRGGTLARLGVLLPLWKTLIGRRFTRVFLLHVDRRYRLVIAPVFGATITAQSPRDAHGAMNPVPGRYFGDEYARLLDGLAHVGPIAGHYPLARLRPLPSVPSVAAFHSPTDERCRMRIAVVPGGGRNVMRESAVRRWPTQHYAGIAQSLIADDCEVVLVGDTNDDWVKPAFSDLPVVDCVGKTTLPQTLALFASCDLVISHDTGPMHLARLAGAPLVALFGPTMPAQFMIEDAMTKVLWGGADLACRPCYDGREFAACTDNICMSGISPDVVLATARALLASGRPHQPAGSPLPQ
jgi:heptosyltransferase-2